MYQILAKIIVSRARRAAAPNLPSTYIKADHFCSNFSVLETVHIGLLSNLVSR
jgi:hypothetical protein